MKKLYLILIQFSFVVSTISAQSYLAFNYTEDIDLSKMGLKDPSIFESSRNNKTVEDIEVFTKSIDLYLNDQGKASIKPEDIGYTNLENDDVISMEVFPNRFDKSQVGRNVVELFVVTKSGYQTSSEEVVTVLDNLAPVVKTKNIRLSLGLKETIQLKVCDVDDGSYDNCRIKRIELSKDIFTEDDLGANLVEVTVVDIFDNKSSALAVVLIEK